MRGSLQLYNHACRITLFTRAHCSLCDQAKDVLRSLHQTRPFELAQVDVMASQAKPWADLYQFDVPVIHVRRSDSPVDRPEEAHRAIKLMHRFTADEVEAKMQLVEQARA